MRDLTAGNEASLIFKFAIPMVVGNLFLQLYNIVDSIIVGQILGTEALAAVGASFPINYTLIAFIIGIGSGATVVVSQYFGAKNYEMVKNAISTIYVFMFIAGISLTIIGIYFSDAIFSLLNLEESVKSEAVKYFNIYMLGMVGFFGFNSTSSILRGLGNSRTPMFLMAISTIVNIGLDLLFIIVFKWGIAGAAWATVISQGGAFIAVVIFLNRKKHIIKVNFKLNRFNKTVFLQSIKIGLPTGFQQTFVALGMLALIRIINNFDTSTLAAFTAASRIDALASMPCMTLASAFSSFVGQNMGAKLTERVKSGLWATLKMAWIISITIMIIVFFWGDKLISLFDSNPEVIRQGTEYLIIVSSFYVIFSTTFVFHGLMRGAGATLIPMFITLLSLWLIRIPFAWFLSAHYNESGIWWSIPAGWIIGFIITLIYYKTDKWKKRAVIK